MSTLSVTLRWKNQMSTEDSIRIYKSLAPFDLQAMPDPLVTLPPGTNSYKDDEVENAVDYYYIISSVKDNIEKFSTQKTFSPRYLELGPGPSVLVGNNDAAGFFGEVPASELITGTALASLIGLTAGTAQNNDVAWLKYFLDEMILFIPKMTHRHTVSWDQINAVNAVYGDRVVEIQGYQFKVRLLKGTNPDTSVPESTGYDVSYGYNSEWNRLIYPTVQDNPTYPQTSQVGPDWATYTEAELNTTSGNGRYTWCQDTPSAYPTQRVLRGSYGVSYLNRSASFNSAANYGWRPCLELVSS